MININAKAAVEFTNTLEKMHRSALPNAVRSTLNSAAFDVKKNTMPQEADRQFTQRSPNFFKANSRVDMAKGWDIRRMEATVGFMNGGGMGVKRAVSELEQQEYGGTIGGRSFIPLSSARIGGGKDKNVRAANRISKIRNIVNSNTMQGKNPKQQFMKAVVKAGVGGYVLGNNKQQILYRVEALGTRMKLKPLFSYKQNRFVRIQGTGFMRTASMESASKMESIYAKEAKRQIERLNK